MCLPCSSGTLWGNLSASLRELACSVMTVLHSKHNELEFSGTTFTKKCDVSSGFWMTRTPGLKGSLPEQLNATAGHSILKAPTLLSCGG